MDDLIVAVNGKPIFNLEEIVPFLKENAGGTITLTVNREGQIASYRFAGSFRPLTPIRMRPMDFGIDWGRVVFSHPTPWSQVKDAATSIFRMVGALLSPKSDVKAAHFSGPVGIMRLYYQVFETNYGWQLALSLSVLINVNLAILNLLPFPCARWRTHRSCHRRRYSAQADQRARSRSRADGLRRPPYRLHALCHLL